MNWLGALVGVVRCSAATPIDHRPTDAGSRDRGTMAATRIRNENAWLLALIVTREQPLPARGSIGHER